MRLSAEARELLQAMAGGSFLKSHRDIEGHKDYKLHLPDGRSRLVAPGVVERLRRQGLIDSNKKFPVATFWLTETGRQAAARPPAGK